jgi:cation:H+ antiporter
MELALYSVVFAASAGALYVSGEWLVRGLERLSRALRVRRFVVAFFVMASAASFPNLFVGLTSVLEGVPVLSLGDVFGNSLISLTVAVAAGVFFSARGSIEAGGETVRATILFAVAAAILPVILISDGALSRGDGLILLGLFVLYLRWIFSRHERFSTVYRHPTQPKESLLVRARQSLHDGILVAGSLILLLLASWGIVESSSFFALHFGIPLLLVGMLIVGLGNALPETYFSVIAARHGDTALIMGTITGSVIMLTTLVLGTVAVLAPMEVLEVEFLTHSRVFLIAAAVLFFIFASTDRRIGRFEAFLLLALYLGFLVWVVPMGF